jgi:hypothetical protein
MIVGPINEIQQYIDGRYLSASEGVDSLLSFKKHTEWPPVIRLLVHLPGQHNVIFNENEDLAIVVERAARQKTTLTAYFAYNAQNVDGQQVVYIDFPANHVWKIREKVWSARQQGGKAVGRMYFVHPTAGEHFFFRLLLTVVPGATSFEHLQTVDDTEHPTFQVACKTLGLLQDDVEWDMCMREACIDQDAKRLRNLFVTLLLFCSPLNPEVLWERYRNDMSHDMRHRRITNGGTIEDAYNDTLLLFEAKLALMNKGLHDFLEMPLAFPPTKTLRVNPQLAAELNYDRDVLHRYVDQNLPPLNICQETAITTVFNAITQGEGAIFFLDARGGSGKTFVYSILLASVPQDGHVAIGSTRWTRCHWGCLFRHSSSPIGRWTNLTFSFQDPNYPW